MLGVTNSKVSKNNQIEYVLLSIVCVLSSSLVHLKNSWYFYFRFISQRTFIWNITKTQCICYCDIQKSEKTFSSKKFFLPRCLFKCTYSFINSEIEWKVIVQNKWSSPIHVSIDNRTVIRLETAISGSLSHIAINCADCFHQKSRLQIVNLQILEKVMENFCF